MKSLALVPLCLILALTGCQRADDEAGPSNVESIVSELMMLEPQIWPDVQQVVSKNWLTEAVGMSVYAYPDRSVEVEVTTERQPPINADTAGQIADLVAPFIDDNKTWSVTVIYRYPDRQRDMRRQAFTVKVKKGKRV